MSIYVLDEQDRMVIAGIISGDYFPTEACEICVGLFSGKENVAYDSGSVRTFFVPEHRHPCSFCGAYDLTESHCNHSKSEYVRQLFDMRKDKPDD